MGITLWWEKINYMLEIDILRNSSKRFECAEWCFLRVWVSKRHPDTLLAKTMVQWTPDVNAPQHAHASPACKQAVLKHTSGWVLVFEICEHFWLKNIDWEWDLYIIEGGTLFFISLKWQLPIRYFVNVLLWIPVWFCMPQILISAAINSPACQKGQFTLQSCPSRRFVGKIFGYYTPKF